MMINSLMRRAYQELLCSCMRQALEQQRAAPKQAAGSCQNLEGERRRLWTAAASPAPPGDALAGLSTLSEVPVQVEAQVGPEHRAQAGQGLLSGTNDQLCTSSVLHLPWVSVAEIVMSHRHAVPEQSLYTSTCCCLQRYIVDVTLAATFSVESMTLGWCMLLAA